MENRSPASGSASKRPRLHSNIRDTSATHPRSATPPSTQERTLRNPSDTVTPSPSQNGTNPSSGDAPYTVFISHAGEDKAKIAIPLREKLRAKGITAFVDEADMPCGTDAVQAMTMAMKTTRIGVFILSPEFIAEKWPMKELMHFLKRRDESSREGQGECEAPTIIPCFYRLSVADLYHEPQLSRKDKDGDLLYEKTAFFDRMKNGEPEADLTKINMALKSLHKTMGVRNDDHANNSSSTEMIQKRELLLDDLCNKICENVAQGMKMKNPRDTARGRNHDSLPADSFRRWFPPKLIRKKAVLDFDARNADGRPSTPEGQIKEYLVQYNDRSAGIVALWGLGGVGKSTIVEVLMSDDDVRKCFPDGVHLIRLGSDASRNALIESVYRILEECGAEKKAQRLRERNNNDEVLDYFMKWFEGKRCLFFIDDVWARGGNVRALSRLCDVAKIDGGNQILITTREYGIASLARDTRIVTLTPRESGGETARKMLLFHAGGEETDVVMADAADPISGILDICAGLPVYLAAAGKSVRKLIRLNERHAVSVWKEYFSRLDASRERLLRQDVESYGKLYETFAASVEFLDEETHGKRTGFKTKFSFAEMHRRLCVLQKQAILPNTMLMRLWETESEESADMIAMAFVEVGLGGHETVQRECGWKSRFSLHDSIYDFAVSEARRHGEVAKTHDLLLKVYGSGHEDLSLESEDKLVRWWSRGIEDDGYIHKQLCRHLVESGRKHELCQLLLTPLWAERQMEVNGIMYLEADFGTGMNEITESKEKKEALGLIRDAVILSSGFVMRNMSELWFQLHGRLQGCREANREIEKYVRWIETDAAKPRVLCVNRGLVGAGGRNTKIVDVGGAGVHCMALFPDEERVACGCDDGSVVVVNIRLSEIERKWKACRYGPSANAVESIAVTQNGTRIITKLSPMKKRHIGESVVDVWNVESGHYVDVIGYHTDVIRRPNVMSCFAITHDETFLVYVSVEGSLQLWDWKTGEVVIPAINVGFGAVDIKLLKDRKDGERAVIRYRDRSLKLWNMDTGARTREFGDFEIDCFTVTPDEGRIVSYSEDGKVTLWDLESRQQIWSSRSDSYITSVAVSKDGSRIASGCRNGVVQVWDLESGDQVCEPLKGHANRVFGVSFVGNKDSIVSCSLDGTVRVWNTVRGHNEEQSFATNREVVTAVSFTPDGKSVVTGSTNNELRIWDAASGQTVGDPLRGHSDWVKDVRVTPDGRYIVSASLDGTVRVWDLESRKPLHTLKDHIYIVNCVAVTPQGDRAVTVSDDETVVAWDLTKMNRSHSVRKGDSECVRRMFVSVERVFVSDDGLRVISVDYGNRIFVWNVETEEILISVVVYDARKMSRREVFNLIGEYTVHNDAGLSIPLESRQIIHGNGSKARVLATLESNVESWDISPEKKTICLALDNGQVAFFKLDLAL